MWAKIFNGYFVFTEVQWGQEALNRDFKVIQKISLFDWPGTTSVTNDANVSQVV